MTDKKELAEQILLKHIGTSDARDIEDIMTIYGKQVVITAIIEAMGEKPEVIIIKRLYDLAEQIGMMLTSEMWTEEFRRKFNPIMTEAEVYLSNSTNVEAMGVQPGDLELPQNPPKVKNADGTDHIQCA